MMLKSKRGIALPFLGKLVIILIGAIIVISFTTTAVAKAKPKQLEQICQNSVLARSKSQVNMEIVVEHTLSPTPLLCKTSEKEIEGNKKEVLKEVADSMARCWWMFNEGKYKGILRDIEIGATMDCFRCYDLFVGPKSEEVSEGELISYLTSEKYKKFGIPYYLYLKYLSTNHFVSIAPGTAYSVVFAQGPDGNAAIVLGKQEDTFYYSLRTVAEEVVGYVPDRRERKLINCRTGPQGG